MRENITSEDSSSLMIVYDEKIKKDISKLITAKKEGKTKDYLEKMIEKMVSENYIILAKMLGEPPLEINFEYRNKDNVLITKKLTPQEFYHRYSSLNLDDFVSVGSMKMYNKEYYKIYQKQYSRNILATSTVRFLNLPLTEFKNLIVSELKDGIPVWFGAEVKKMRNQENGILDMNSYNYEEVFNYERLTQEENLNLHAITLAHAMSFVGVHIVDDKIIRWKVENSWGDKDNKGYFIMNDNYFDEFVMNAVVKKEYLTSKQLEMLNQEAINMNPNDPF